MRTALYNSIKASVVPYIPKTYQYFQTGLTYSLKTVQKSLPNYKFRRIDINNINPNQNLLPIITVIEEKHKEIVAEDIPIESPLEFTFKEDIPLELVIHKSHHKAHHKAIHQEIIPLVIPIKDIPLVCIAKDIIPLVIPVEEDIPAETIEPELKFKFKKDIPQELVVGARDINTALGKLRKKNILIGKNRILTWKNLTPVPDSIIIAAKKLWENICGIQFIQVTDGKKPDFTFELAGETLENHPGLKGTIAMAFFPGDSPRIVKIFKLFDSQFNKVAALAHELGHIMGFCHEHEDHIKNRHFTDDLYEEYISEYDPQSIMNYSNLWRDEAAKRLTKLSDLDIKGAKQLYGEPINGAKDLQMSG